MLGYVLIHLFSAYLLSIYMCQALYQALRRLRRQKQVQWSLVSWNLESSVRAGTDHPNNFKF